MQTINKVIIRLKFSVDANVAQLSINHSLLKARIFFIEKIYTAIIKVLFKCSNSSLEVLISSIRQFCNRQFNHNKFF